MFCLHFLLFWLFQQIVDFIDKICSKCPKLERFVYEGYSDSFECISIDFPKEPSKEEDKFQNLTYIYVEFVAEEDYYEDEFEATLENFKKYLTAKCPKLQKPIQLDSSDEYQVVFESKWFENCDDRFKPVMKVNVKEYLI